MPGTLFVVATPIGNLEDLTFRALRTLREVDLIAAEDTRRTSRLLAHYQIQKPLVSLHEHNEHREAPRLVARIAAGESVALVSDAGTPAISDPGTTLVRLAREAGLRVTPIPGASAIIAALSVSGVPATPFTFLGFPPRSGVARDRWLEALHAVAGTAVFFEAPHRIAATMADIREVSADRPIIIAREISKLNEELVEWDNRNRKDDGQDEPAIRDQGEFVIVVGPRGASETKDIDDLDALRLFDRLTLKASLSDDEAFESMAAMTGASTRQIAKIIKKARISVKRQNEQSS